MKKLFPSLPLFLLAISFGASPLARAVEPAMTPVAVLDFEASDPKLKERGGQLATLVAAQLSAKDGIVVVERQDLAKILGEQELGASGMVDPNTAARIGHLTGARVLVLGRVFTVAGETTAALKVMSTETSRVYGVVENFPVDAAPSGPATKLANKVAETLESKRSTLVAAILSEGDRVERIKRKLAGRTLPSVTISIPEAHIGARVVDPAAETEIGSILSKAGFTLLTGAAAENADFRIKGEAFSETGIRRGNLVSCRARVEVQAVARATGKMALVDRETSWGVDTAEHIAGKKALQEAGAVLAERLADVLAARP